LSLQDPKSILEGWAIVDNTTDEDWNQVNLSVVSGRPISFISLLDVPRYGQREVAELPEDRAAGPVVYGGSVDIVAKAQAASGVGAGNGSGYPAGSAGIRSGTFAVSDGTHMGSGFVAGQLQSVQVTSKSE